MSQIQIKNRIVSQFSQIKSLFSLLLVASVFLSACSEVSTSNQNRSSVNQPVGVSQTATTTTNTATMASNTAGASAPLTEDSTAGERYAEIEENPFLDTARAPLSTFSIDVDTAAYSNVRRFLNDGQLPPRDAVRIEELVNYFEYDYPTPAGDTPFSVVTEAAACPWNAKHKIALIGLQGKKIALDNVPPSNLVFLIDTSGSMSAPHKLPLLKQSFRTLVNQLSAKDRVAIVTYAGSSGVALRSTNADKKSEILASLDDLESSGSTNGGAGIGLAYKTAQENFVENGNNRVILATDGDFNVGLSSDEELVKLIEQKRQSGVFLSVLGFGTGNTNDSMMEKLADKGNGNYAYIDTAAEARKALGRQVAGTLYTIAKDVKIQVEFNPALVAGYRLIGYENRLLANRDFNDDKKDAGEIGAGASVTALYEIIPAGQKLEDSGVDDLKYSAQNVAANNTDSSTLR